MKSYFPKTPVDVVAGGLTANYTDDQYKALLEEMAPVAKQVGRSSTFSRSTCRINFW
jgi:hypothetical protein